MSRPELPWKAPPTRPKFADRQLDALSKELEARWNAMDRQLSKASQSAMQNAGRLESLERRVADLRAHPESPS